jgi:hypothetical protein
MNDNHTAQPWHESPQSREPHVDALLDDVLDMLADLADTLENLADDHLGALVLTDDLADTADVVGRAPAHLVLAAFKTVGTSDTLAQRFRATVGAILDDAADSIDPTRPDDAAAAAAAACTAFRALTRTSQRIRGISKAPRAAGAEQLC